MSRVLEVLETMGGVAPSRRALELAVSPGSRKRGRELVSASQDAGEIELNPRHPGASPRGAGAIVAVSMRAEIEAPTEPEIPIEAYTPDILTRPGVKLIWAAALDWILLREGSKAEMEELFLKLRQRFAGRGLKLIDRDAGFMFVRFGDIRGETLEEIAEVVNALEEL
jgi:hypothetical protein